MDILYFLLASLVLAVAILFGGARVVAKGSAERIKLLGNGAAAGIVILAAAVAYAIVHKRNQIPPMPDDPLFHVGLSARILPVLVKGVPATIPLEFHDWPKIRGEKGFDGLTIKPTRLWRFEGGPDIKIQESEANLKVLANPEPLKPDEKPTFLQLELSLTADPSAPTGLNSYALDFTMPGYGYTGIDPQLTWFSWFVPLYVADTPEQAESVRAASARAKEARKRIEEEIKVQRPDAWVRALLVAGLLVLAALGRLVHVAHKKLR